MATRPQQQAPLQPPDTQQRQLLELAAERLASDASRRAAAAAPSGAAGGAAASSSYDYVKIKVRLGAHLEHYYILSRFLLSRMLTVITLPQHKASGVCVGEGGQHELGHVCRRALCPASGCAHGSGCAWM